MNHPIPCLAALSFLLAVPAPCLVAAEDPYLVARHLPLADGGSLRVVADLDGDGLDDLLCFRSGNPSGVGTWTAVDSLMNDGDLRFSLAGSVPLDGGSAAAAVSQPVVGDVTGDGVVDLVLDYRGAGGNPDNRMELFPGVGDGTFAAAIPFVNEFVWDYVLGQVDLDPALEVGVWHSDASLDRILDWWDFNGVGMTNLGSLSLSPQASLRALTAMDVNADGFDDLVAAEGFLPDRMTFFPTVGGVPTVGASFSYPGALQNVNHNIQVGDLDGNGLSDLLLMTRDVLNGVTSFLRYKQQSPGSFVSSIVQDLADPVFPFFFNLSAQLVDWDRDGDLDLVSGGGIVTVLENDGFLFRFGFDEYSGGSQVFAGVGDLDADGWPDFADQVSVVRGRGDFQVVQRYGDPFPVNNQYQDIEDHDGDGDTDLRNQNFGYEVNDATGVFTSTGSLLPRPPADHLFDTRTPAGFGDFDGDGSRDWVLGLDLIVQEFPPILDFQNMVLIAEVDGRLIQQQDATAPQVRIPGNLRQPWPAGDLDDDGDQDIVVTGGFWDNDGTGFFTGFVAAFSGRPLRVEDVNGDGRDDVFVRQGGSLRVLFNQGGLGFTALDLGPFDADLVLARVNLDADPDLDLAVSSAIGESVALFEFQSGVFAPAAVLEVPGLSTGRVGALDANQDGLRDVGIGRRTAGGLNVLTVFPRRGAGWSFDPPREWVTRSAVNGFLDVDGDGDVDALSNAVLENFTFDGPAAGVIRQYGAGHPGSNGIVPVFGSAGPLQPGAVASARIRRTVGGARGLIAIGLAETSIPLGPGRPTLLVTPLLLTVPFKASGPNGVPAAGEWTLDYTVDPAWAGAQVFEQVFVFDPAGLAASNGLELVYGQ